MECCSCAAAVTQRMPLVSAVWLMWWASTEAVYTLPVTVTRMGVNGPSVMNKLSVFCVEHVQRLLTGILHSRLLCIKMNPEEAVSLWSCVMHN